MSLTPCPCACVTETRLDWQEKLIRTIMRYIGILHDVKIPSNETSAAIATATKATQSKTTLTQLSKLQLSIRQVLPLPPLIHVSFACTCACAWSGGLLGSRAFLPRAAQKGLRKREHDCPREREGLGTQTALAQEKAG